MGDGWVKGQVGRSERGFNRVRRETIGKKLTLTTSPIECPTCQGETQTAKNYTKNAAGATYTALSR